MERVVSWSLRSGCDMPESSEPPLTGNALSDFASRRFHDFHRAPNMHAHLGQNTLNQPCGDPEPTFAQSCASTDAPLSNPSSSTHTDSRVEVVGSIETWVVASWGCERCVHTCQCLPRGCVAATGRATSVGLSVLIGIEREAAIQLAGGKPLLRLLFTPLFTAIGPPGRPAPGTTTEPAVPARTRLVCCHGAHACDSHGGVTLVWTTQVF